MTDEIKALADKWLNKVPHFMPENMSHLVGMEKQAFEAGYKAALSGTERVECYLPDIDNPDLVAENINDTNEVHYLKKVTLTVVRESDLVTSDNKSSSSGGDAPVDSSNSIEQKRPFSDFKMDELIDFIHIGQPDIDAPYSDFEEVLNDLREKGIKTFDFSDVPPEIVFKQVQFLMNKGFDVPLLNHQS